MKTLLSVLSISLLSAGAANAGTLNCVGDRLAYSHDYTDGGAPRAPSISLVLDGRVLIKTAMFENEPVNEGRFELTGRKSLIKKSQKGFYVTSFFEQDARVTQQNVDPVLFSGQVLCKEVRYVGPPRP